MNDGKELRNTLRIFNLKRKSDLKLKSIKHTLRLHSVINAENKIKNLLIFCYDLQNLLYKAKCIGYRGFPV